jgi:DNA-binding transcriptional LysR family regulator
MELRHLRYFVAVAEELNFTRAAQRLGIRQPSLSAQIKQLERELGTQFFRRLTRGLELTDTGKSFLDEARRILDHVARAKIDIERRARGELGQLKIGFANGTSLNARVPRIVLEYFRKFPDVVLSPDQGTTAALVRRVRLGDIDLAFVRPPLIDEPALALESVDEEDVVAVLSRIHPLAGASSLPLAALSHDVFILPPRSNSPGFLNKIFAACMDAGFKPILGVSASQIVSCVPMVEAGFGVSLVPKSVSRICGNDVSYVSLTGRPLSAQIKIAYRRGDRSPPVRNFIAMARRVVRDGAHPFAADLVPVSASRVRT